jgi:toxin ParE1/3/4
MTRLLLIHETAEAEINEAADFYDVASPGLGRVFLDEIQHALERITEFPEAAPLIRGRVRKRVVAKFPYSLVYSVRPEAIRILAAAHHKRRPFYWRGRR